jgi:hypothetical protein
MNTDNPVIRVVDGPVRVDGVPMRLVELADRSGRVESWRHGRWTPGGCDMKDVLTGTPIPDPEAT